MRLEHLRTSPDRLGRYLAQFSDGSSLKLYRQTVEDNALFSGKEFSDEEYEALVLSEKRMSAKMRAVRIVSATNITKRELQSRLIQKGEDVQASVNAVEWLGELSLLDDKKTAEQIVASCIAKGYGCARAKQVLYEKRVPRDVAEDALLDYPDQEEAILFFLKSRLRDWDDEKEVRRVINALLRRGHRYEQISRVFRENYGACSVLEDD